MSQAGKQDTETSCSVMVLTTMPSSDATCPVCGDGYARRIIVERGQQWDDLYPGSPLAFFRKYQRRCTTQYDSKRDARVAEDECTVYFHDDDGIRAVF